MKITHIDVFPVRIPLKPSRHMVTSLGWHTESKYLLVRVGTSVGIEGWGEATVMPLWSGESVWGAQAIVEHLFAPALIGADPLQVSEIDRRLDRAARHNWFAKSALEMACWDIRGKFEQRPVFALLGGAVRPLTVRCRYSMGAYEPEHAAARARELVAEGFTTIKIKVGGVPEQDILRVRSVRDAIGADLALTIDANCGWDADTAIACVNELHECRITLNEQPTPDGDYASLAKVRAATKPPVMADDMCFDRIHAEELIRHNACDSISVYPGKNGGIRKSRKIAELAERHGVQCSIGSNLEWDIATAAMAHLVVATPNLCVESLPGDMLGPDYHEVRIAKDPIAIHGPLVTLSDRPGLGVEVDMDVVKEFRLR